MMSRVIYGTDTVQEAAMLLGLIYFHFSLKPILRFLIDNSDTSPHKHHIFFSLKDNQGISFRHTDFTSKPE